MEQTFNADEVFEIAELIERNGAAFYRRSAQIAASLPARQLLLELEDMEMRHEKIFAAMRDKLWDEAPDWLPKFFSVDEEEHAAQYLRAVAAGHVFDLKTDPASVLPRTASLESILRTAISLEKDSIVFYLGLRSAVPENLGRDKVDAVIREELGHITLLSRELAAATR